jgi:hypothetical protein
MNIMLQVFVIANHVRWRTLDMLPCGRKKVGIIIPGFQGLELRFLTGILYLYVKTIERAHSPAHMWERIKLSNSYAKALEQVSLDCSSSTNAR